MDTNRHESFKAAILEELNSPLTIGNLQSAISNPEHGQVLVRVLVAGICGAQLQEIRGDKGDPSHLPHLLGHEGCGIVEQIGPGVKHVKEGDKVVMHWRKGNGCDAEGAVYNIDRPPTKLESWRQGFLQRNFKVPVPALAINSGPLTCFSEYTIVSENRVTPVPQDFPDDLACLLGCSLSTALGVIENEARVKMGESVMIVGCGGVGLALILAARLAHAFPIIAVDKSMDKVDMVRDLGADYFAEGFEDSDIHDVDVVIDTTGSVSAISAASTWLKDSGRMILVGQPQSKAKLELPQASRLFHGTGKTIKATQGGCFSPSTDIPRYINLWRSGALDGWENLITHRVSLDDINKGIDLVREGKAGRVLIDMNLIPLRARLRSIESCDTALPKLRSAEQRAGGAAVMSGGLSGGNEVADVIQSQPLTHSLTSFEAGGVVG